MRPAPVKDRGGNIIGYRVGSTSYTFGRSDIFLGSIIAALTRRARKLGILLEEEHIRDDIIETFIHEDLHMAIHEAVDALGASKINPLEEERVVDSISEWAVKDIRQRPKLDLPETSVSIKREILAGRAYVNKERRMMMTSHRPVHVRQYRRRRRW